MAISTPGISLDTKKIAQENITLHVRLHKYHSWLWRLRVAEWLIRFAAYVAWVNIEITNDNNDNETECQP